MARKGIMPQNFPHTRLRGSELTKPEPDRKQCGLTAVQLEGIAGVVAVGDLVSDINSNYLARTREGSVGRQMNSAFPLALGYIQGPQCGCLSPCGESPAGPEKEGEPGTLCILYFQSYTIASARIITFVNNPRTRVQCLPTLNSLQAAC